MPDDAVECFSPRFREPNDLSITHFRSLGVLWSGWLPALFELGDEASSSDFFAESSPDDVGFIRSEVEHNRS